MLPNGAIGEEFVTFQQDLTDRRKIERIDQLKSGGEFRSQKKNRDTDHAKPVGNRFARALPKPIGGQRVGLIDGNEFDGFLFGFRRKELLWLQCRKCMRRASFCQARFSGEFQILYSIFATVPGPWQSGIRHAVSIIPSASSP